MTDFPFEFEYPWFLLLLVPYTAILFFAWKRKEPALTVPSLLPFRMAEGNTQKKRPDLPKLIVFLCFAAAGVCLITGLARPRKGLEIIRSKADGIDIILAVDLSGSMSAIDVPQHYSRAKTEDALRNKKLKTRLEASKKAIAKFIESRPCDRIGLIAFAERPYVICPPTLDHAFLLANLFRMEPQMIGDGTGIAGPIASAVNRLKDMDSKSRIVVLFTDGANTVPMQITPEEAAKLADTFKITIYTVGIGSGNAYVPSLFGFEPYPEQFDEKLLNEIASITGGKYYHAADESGMDQAMRAIDKLEKTSAEQPAMTVWKEYYPLMAWCAAGAMLLGLALQCTVCWRFP
jgi:Ca-activated chloride channel family protein